ncbi:MAG: hypothetical protein H7124_05600 [Phycisphaerales bacterium]|nr:hypothetical protein [Hyphomonadaceae bacterium]
MISRLSVFCAAAAALLALAAPASAQDEALGPYCCEVTWQGQAPIDTWVYLRRNGSWTAAVEGALSEVDRGPYTLNGATLTMSGGESVQYQIGATAAGGRLSGNVSASDGRRGVISMTQMRGTAAGLRSSPLPPNFSPEAAERR